MNVHALSHNEASFLLFAIKKTLQDRSGLTPAMEQFYDSMYGALSEKLQRISEPGSRDITPPERHRFAEVRPTWRDVTIREIERNQPTDP